MAEPYSFHVLYVTTTMNGIRLPKAICKEWKVFDGNFISLLCYFG